MLGTMAALEGRATDAQRYARELDSLSRADAARGDTAVAEHENAYARAIRGLAAAQRGDLNGGIREIEHALPAMWGISVQAAMMRYQLAKLQLAAGRPREARMYLESLDFSNHMWGIAPTELELGRASEALGDTARAVYHFSRFARWWADCDPELRSWREEAVAAVARLTREPVRAGEPVQRP
jgi:hypothetical protein